MHFLNLQQSNPIIKVQNPTTNDFQYLGQYSSEHQSTVLYWEEVLWLMEKRKLAFSNPNSSVQFYFDLFLNCDCNGSSRRRNLSFYLAYCKFLTLGYVVWRPEFCYLQRHLLVIFRPNARFSKKTPPPIDYLLWVVEQEDDESAHLPLSLLFKISNCNTKINKLVAYVQSGNVNFISVESCGLHSPGYIAPQPKKRKE